jgi:hypothetical protein
MGMKTRPFSAVVMPLWKAAVAALITSFEMSRTFCSSAA